MIIIITPPERFSGVMRIPGDKSVTHRALILGALARGVTEVEGFLDSEDCRATMEALRMLGVRFSERGSRLLIEGRGMRLRNPGPGRIIDAGNSGTTARLLLGVLAGQPFSVTVTGDESLRKRPMKRVTGPLKKMGASIEGPGDCLPLTIQGGPLAPITHASPVASAQVKTAILLAGLYARGDTTVVEPAPSRNHSELLLGQFGASLHEESSGVTLKGPAVLRGCRVKVPGDISTAAFFIAAAAIIPGAEVLLTGVGVNHTRTGVIEVFQAMGVDLALQNQRLWGREPVADILVRGGAPLRAVEIKGALIPRLIDEIPVIAVVAALARGRTVISDAADLRVKETDRLAALAAQLARLGADVEEKDDGLTIEGPASLVGTAVDSCGDHRMAMSLAVAGLVSAGETVVHGAEVIDVSYPRFLMDLRALAGSGT